MSVKLQITPTPVDAAHCPLCRRVNECQLCSVAAYKGPCWCARMEIPDALLAEVPSDLRNQACVCRDCVLKFQRKQSDAVPRKVLPGDFYFDAGGLMVFTAAYHLRRGYCCGSGCRHCPYTGKEPAAAPSL
jgi:hypothetical protein